MGNRQRGNWRTFWNIASMAIWLIPGVNAAGVVIKGMAFTKTLLFTAANILINALLPMLPGKGVDSPAYSWKHEPNLPANADIPMPIVYGKTRVKPVIKSRHVRLDGTKQYLDVLYSFTGHRVDERTIAPWVARLPGNPWNVDDEVTLAGFPGKTYICVKQHTSIRNPVTLGAEWWKLGHGTAYNAGISDITIDNNPIESYETATPDIFTFETRAGAAQQAFIAGFDTNYDNYPQGVLINNPAPTVNLNTAYIKLVSLPGYFYRVNWKRHDLLYFGTVYSIEAGITAPTEQFPAFPLYVLWDLGASKYTISSTHPPLTSPLHIVAEIKTSTTEKAALHIPDNDNHVIEVVLSNIHDIEVIFDFPQGLYNLDWTVGETAFATATIQAFFREVTDPEGIWSWQNKFTGNLNWKETGITTTYDNDLIITANKTDAFSVSWSAREKDKYFDTDKNYQIMVRAICPCRVELANVAGVTYSFPDGDGEYRPHTYPGECLLGIRAMATGYLQGGFEVTAVIERSKVQVRDDAGTWSDKAANCHAWAVYDMLVNGWLSHPEYPNMSNLASFIMPIYGCGIDPDRIDYDSFLELEEYTYNELGFRLNTVFDTTMTIWDAISRICEEGLAAIIPIGSEFRALVDRPALPTEINSLFCMGNINEGTFQQSWVDKSKKARSIEVSFANKDRTPAYTESKFTVRIPEWDTADEQDSPLSMTLYGTTDYVQALAIAQYRLNCNYLLSQMITFETDVEAMELEVGDVIPVQHDTLCGAGGRLAGVDYNLIVNPSFEDGGGNMINWSIWNVPSLRHTDISPVTFGTRSYHHRADSHNSGSYQSITVKSNTTYTLSCWIYMLNYLVSTATLRAMTLVDGTYYSTVTLDKTKLNQWQQVSVTFTTAVAQTTATVWLGGIGECYFDAIMVNQGATACAFMLYNATTLTFDKAMTVTAGKLYELQIVRKDGGIEKKTGITGVAATITIAFGSSWVWGYRPEVYDSYAFGEVGNAVKNFRIMSLIMNSEFKFEIAAMEYDADVYKIDATDSTSTNITTTNMAKIAADLNEPSVVTFPRALSVTLQEVVSLNRTTGQYDSSIVVKFTPPSDVQNGEWEVSWRDTDADEGQLEGVWNLDDAYDVNAIAEKDGIVYISDKSGNLSEPFYYV